MRAETPADDRRMRVAVLGTGALGTVFADALAAVAPTARVGRVGGESALAAAELILVAVKTYDTASALGRVRPVLRADATVVTLQNGIDAVRDVRAALGGAARVFGAVTTESAFRDAAGTVVRGGTGTTTFPDDAALDAVAVLFAEAGLRVRRRADFADAVWAKAIANAAINPTTALAGVPNGALATDPLLRARADALAREAGRVAVAAGATLLDAPEAIVASVVRASAANRSSMLQDLAAGRPTEIEALVGAIVRRAAAFGIAVPALQVALDAVRARG